MIVPGEKTSPGYIEILSPNPSIATPSNRAYCDYISFRFVDLRPILRLIIYFVNWYNCLSMKGVYERYMTRGVIQIIVANEQVNYYFIITY